MTTPNTWRTFVLNHGATLLLAGVLLFAAAMGEHLNNERYAADLRNETQQHLLLVRQRLEANLNSDLQLVKGLVSVITLEPSITQSRFARAATPLFSSETSLRNIGGAPDMIIRLMYPLAGNEKAIGLDYRNTPSQLAAANQARYSGQIAVAGPLNLVQGGEGLIARLPVFVPDDHGVSQFWGLVSAVIDIQSLYSRSGLSDTTLPLHIAIRGKNGTGASGEVFYGDANLFTQEHLEAEIALPSGKWKLAAIPKGGWPTQAANAWQMRALFLVIGGSILLAFMAKTRALSTASKATRRAELASMAKSQFLATMSHEIRTPMNGILGMAQLLLMPSLSPDEQTTYARTILNSGKTLLTLLNDILDFSKIEAGKLDLSMSVFDPQQILKETTLLFADLGTSKGIDIRAHWHGDNALRFRSDPIRLRQMLSNLISNAIKFTAQGSINIEARVVEQTPNSALLEFAVSDTGIGIHPDKLKLLFQPFSQADSTITREFGGTGLGLSIVNSLALMMGGDVGVSSEPGKGSRFWFRIRAELVSADAESRSEGRVLAAPTESGSAPADSHILVVEDNPTNRLVIKSMLSKLGMQVQLAENGQEALDLITLAGCTPDLILMDVQMPLMDGTEATQRIRQWEAAGQHTPQIIVALTANAFDTDRAHYIGIGMNDFLSKPINVKQLSDMLHKWIKTDSLDAHQGQT